MKAILEVDKINIAIFVHQPDIQAAKISTGALKPGRITGNLTLFLICFYFTDWENGTSEFWQDVKTFTMVTYDSTDKNLIEHTCLEE